MNTSPRSGEPLPRSGGQSVQGRWATGSSAAADSLHGIAVVSDGDWIVLQARAPRSRGATRPGRSSGFGLWKPAGPDGGTSLRFEFPAAVSREFDIDRAICPEGACPGPVMEWAAASLHNEIPKGWTPPARDLVDSWLPQGALTLQLGPFLRAGELDLEASRWALRFPVLPDVPRGLSAWRRRSLRALMADAQAQWRMVRVGLVARGQSEAMVAAVDLTGAPHSESLFLAALDGVRHVAAWVTEAADLMCDATLAPQALEVWQSKNISNERQEA